MELKLEKLNKSYSVLTDSGKTIGSFQLDSDGFYYFYEDSQLTGCWGAWELRKIADLLDEVNNPYKKSLDGYFDLEKINFEEQAKVGHRKLLKSGAFWRVYPQLSGNWKNDKEQWLIEYQKLEDLRAQNNSF